MIQGSHECIGAVLYLYVCARFLVLRSLITCPLLIREATIPIGCFHVLVEVKYFGSALFHIMIAALVTPLLSFQHLPPPPPPPLSSPSFSHGSGLGSIPSRVGGGTVRPRRRSRDAAIPRPAGHGRVGHLQGLEARGVFFVHCGQTKNRGGGGR